MIELLLGAERALAAGLVDQAERLYRQAADGDPHNSIAVVGLARVALERGDEPEAWRLARRALDIDPENVAAQRLARRLEEVWAYRGESLPDTARAVPNGGTPVPDPVAEPIPEPVPDPVAEPAPEPSEAPTPAAAGEAAGADAGRPERGPAIPAAPRRSIVDRLLGRKRP